MNTRSLKKLFTLCFITLTSIQLINAQQSTIEYDSDTNPSVGPQLLILETNDPGLNAPADGWARMWFQNTADLSSRWAFLARPHTGAADNQNILNQPIIMAFNGSQKLGLSMDGYLRINKAYTLPNEAGEIGQVLMTVDTSNSNNAETDWVDFYVAVSSVLEETEAYNKLMTDVEEQQVLINKLLNQNEILQSEVFNMKSKLSSIETNSKNITTINE